MPKKFTFKLAENAEDILMKAAMDGINKNGLDLECPNCHHQIHLSFSGDTCEFCGLVINFGTEPDV